MPDLEQQISEWRQQLRAAGIKTPVPLDELENHLREEIEQRMKSGLSEPAAFTAAVLAIGQAQALRNEFKKVQDVQQARAWPIFVVAVIGVIALFVGSCVLFKWGSFAETTPVQQRSGLFATLAMILLCLVGRVGHRFFPVIAARRVRDGIGIAGVLLLALWWAVFFFIILPRHEFTMEQLVVTILWSFMTPAGALSGLMAGIEMAVRKAESVPKLH